MCAVNSEGQGSWGEHNKAVEAKDPYGKQTVQFWKLSFLYTLRNSNNLILKLFPLWGRPPLTQAEWQVD